MNRIAGLLLILMLACLLPAAVKKKVPAKGKSAAKAPLARGKTVNRGKASSSARRSTKATSSRQVAALHQPAHQPARQAAPSSERYKEIQQALATKGYLKKEPNGSWDTESQDAMRRFQADQNLSTTGRISAKSLISLGLGSATPNTQP